LDFGFNYGSFWSRIFTYINSPRRHEGHEEYSHEKAQKNIATETTEGTEFFASRCGLGSGFLDTSICEACGQRPLGHRGWPA